MQVTLAQDATAGRELSTWSAATPDGKAALLSGPADLRSLGPTVLTVLDMAEMSLDSAYAALPVEALQTRTALAMLRVAGPIVEYLISGDVVLVLDADGEHSVITGNGGPESGRIAGLSAAVLLSAGAAAAATDYEVMSWREVLDVVYARGPRDLISLTRELESRDADRTIWPRPEVHPDATAIALTGLPPR